MIDRHSAHVSAGRSNLEPLAALAAATVAPLLAIMLLLPAPLVLPSLSLSALAGAAALTLLAWWRNAAREAEHVTLWDVAGATALIGFAAGTLAEPEQIIDLFERSKAAR